MIDKKFILYVLAGIIGFSLWNAWEKDFGKVVTPVATQQTQAQNSASNGFVPAITNQPSVNAPVISPSVIDKIPTSRLIKVRNDVLEVSIDTLGGNIVSTNLLKYPRIINEEHPIDLLSSDNARYYVAQSGLISNLGPDFASKQATYTVQPSGNNLIVKLFWSNPKGLIVTKIFTFTKDKYDFNVSYEITNNTKEPWQGQFYTQIERKDFDNKKGMFSFNTYTGAAVSSKETPYEKISFSSIESYTKDSKGFIRNSEGGWVAMQQRYFLSAWIPSQNQMYRYYANNRDGIYTIGLSNDAVSVGPGQKSAVGAKLYVGPEVVDNIDSLAKGMDHTVDYGWLWPIAIVLFWILKKINLFLCNWGWSIIVLTLFIKLVFYKLSETSCRSMARMRELMPKMQALKERYADDKQKLQQATMELYKQEGVNPLNMAGCLPMLIQIPFFIALYYVLMGAIELRHAPFIFWITDLSSHDPFFVLPILMGLSMVLQQRLNPTSGDPAQAKVMMFMPVIFTAFFLYFPSGLVLYWFVSNMLSILQQMYINKKILNSANIRKK